MNIMGANLKWKEYVDLLKGNWYSTHSENLSLVNFDWNKYSDFIREDYIKIKIKKEVKNTLKFLNRKYHFGIVSSGAESVIKPHLENNEINHYFDFVYGKETSFSKVMKLKMVLDKFSLEPDEAVFVTDTLGDIHESNEVGIPSIAIEGVHTKNILKLGEPIGHIQHFSELGRFFQK